MTAFQLLNPGSRRGGETRWRHSKASTLLLLLLAREPLAGEADAKGGDLLEDREEAARGHAISHAKIPSVTNKHTHNTCICMYGWH